MKIRKILFALCLLLIAPFFVIGCGEETNNQGGNQGNNDVTKAKTEAEVVAMFADFIDLENINFTLEGDAEYEITNTPAVAPAPEAPEAPEMPSGAIEGMVLKITEDGFSVLLPNIAEMIFLGNTSMERDYEPFKEAVPAVPAIPADEEAGTPEVPAVPAQPEVAAHWNKWEVNTYISDEESMLDTVFGVLTDFNPEIKAVFAELLLNLADNVTVSKLASGAYQVSIDANLKENLNFIIKAIYDNKDVNIGKTIDILLDKYVEEDLTIAALVADIKEKFDADTTVAEVITYVEGKFDIKITALFNLVEKIAKFALISEGEAESVINQLNFKIMTLFDLIDTISGAKDEEDKMNKTTFDATMDGIAAMLDYTPEAPVDPEAPAASDPMSLTGLLGNLDEIEMGSIIMSMLGGLKFEDAALNITLTSNTANTAFENLSGSVNFQIAMMGEAEDSTPEEPKFEKLSTIALVASFEFTIKDRGTTTIALASIDNIDKIQDLDINFSVTESQLTRNTDLVINNVDSISINLSFKSSNGYAVTYNATNHTVTISKEFVNHILDSYIEDDNDQPGNTLFHSDLVVGDGVNTAYSCYFEVNKTTAPAAPV